MSTATAIFNEDGQAANRRGCAREPLKWVVLVFFGENNWGKLLDINERGMRFEYAEPPSLGQRIGFTFEAMGRLPAHFGGEVVSNSFRAAGEIKWTREFERMAGVEFRGLAEESREHIRHWLSFEASSSSVTRSGEAKREAPASQPKMIEPVASSAEDAGRKVGPDGSGPELEKSECKVEPMGTLDSQLVAKILEAPTFEAYSKLLADADQKHKPLSGSKRWMTRTGLLAVSGCLAILAVAAGVKMILPVWARKSEAATRIASLSMNESEPSSAKFYPNGKNPFLVEVLDAENRRWLLWFVNKAPKNRPDQGDRESSVPSSPGPLARAAGQTRQLASAKPGPSHEFTLVSPNVSHPQASGLTENSLSTAVSAVPAEAPPLAAAIGGMAARGAKPVPVTQALPVGGQVQVARLVRSVPPVYPPLAKTNHVAGNVTLDALIDANGKVTDVKVLSGPSLLQGAATDALRLWKYEPARLDGHPVSTRLSVIVKFRAE
jgi:TonB family protein